MLSIFPHCLSESIQLTVGGMQLNNDLKQGCCIRVQRFLIFPLHFLGHFVLSLHSLGVLASPFMPLISFPPRQFTHILLYLSDNSHFFALLKILHFPSISTIPFLNLLKCHETLNQTSLLRHSWLQFTAPPQHIFSPKSPAMTADAH